VPVKIVSKQKKKGNMPLCVRLHCGGVQCCCCCCWSMLVRTVEIDIVGGAGVGVVASCVNI